MDGGYLWVGEPRAGMSLLPDSPTLFLHATVTNKNSWERKDSLYWEPLSLLSSSSSFGFSERSEPTIVVSILKGFV
jgi:hypothetical protein